MRNEKYADEIIKLLRKILKRKTASIVPTVNVSSVTKISDWKSIHLPSRPSISRDAASMRPPPLSRPNDAQKTKECTNIKGNTSEQSSISIFLETFSLILR